MNWEVIQARLEERIRPILENRWDGTTGELVKGDKFIPGIPIDDGVGEKPELAVFGGRPGVGLRLGRRGEARPTVAELGWDPYERLFPFDESELD